MEIIKKKKLRKLKECRRACRLIYDIIQSKKEDVHGNVIPYQNDHTIKQILDVLETVGVGMDKPIIAHTIESEWSEPWERKA